MPSKSEIYKEFVYPQLRKFDPETLHDDAIFGLETLQNNEFGLKILERISSQDGNRLEDKRLNVEVGGVSLENPVGLAAGFDKDGQAVDALYRMGFATIVAGTVTEVPQEGNPKPRISRLDGENLLNSMGFPNKGLLKMRQTLARYQDRTYPIGVSIGINRDLPHIHAPDAYARAAHLLDKYADYFEINVSSPNTKDLRELESGLWLSDIFRAVRDYTGKPLFVKVSPDITTEALDGVIDVAESMNVAIVATNTSIDPALKASFGVFESGGISGPAIEDRANYLIKHIASHAPRIDIVGVGGVRDGQSALRKLSAGARSISLYTGLIYEGPTVANKINQEILDFMDKEGVNKIEDLMGEKI